MVLKVINRTLNGLLNQMGGSVMQISVNDYVVISSERFKNDSDDLRRIWVVRQVENEFVYVKHPLLAKSDPTALQISSTFNDLEKRMFLNRDIVKILTITDISLINGLVSTNHTSNLQYLNNMRLLFHSIV